MNIDRSTDDFVVQGATLSLGESAIPIYHNQSPPLRIEFGAQCKLSFATPNLGRVYEWWCVPGDKVVTVTFHSVARTTMSLRFVCNDWEVNRDMVKMVLIAEHGDYARMEVQMAKGATKGGEK